MGIVAHLKGPQGPAGANGVVGLFVAAFANGAWSVLKTSPAISFTPATGVVKFLVAGWYEISNVGGDQPKQYALNATVTLVHGASVAVEGPLT